MKFNMQQWTKELLESKTKKAFPILSFPSVQLMNVSVKELINSSDLQAKGMKAVADRCPTAAAVSLMDLSVEAECFGSPISFSDDEVPTVSGPVIDPMEDEETHLKKANEMRVPKVGEGRTQIYIDAIGKAKEMINDRPVIAGVIGPFSLVGRLVDVTNAMVFCYTEPEYLHVLLRKATDFILEYIKAYKAVGADGVMMAEPLAGLLSPDLAAEFSGKYCKEISEAVKSEDFSFIYHNCGNTANVTIDSILMADADAYSFGDAVSMKEMMEKMPADAVCIGNVSPAHQFRGGTPDSIREETLSIMKDCCSHPNFVIASGCDIPPMSSWDNIDAFFKAVDEFYQA